MAETITITDILGQENIASTSDVTSSTSVGIVDDLENKPANEALDELMRYCNRLDSSSRAVSKAQLPDVSRQMLEIVTPALSDAIKFVRSIINITPADSTFIQAYVWCLCKLRNKYSAMFELGYLMFIGYLPELIVCPILNNTGAALDASAMFKFCADANYGNASYYLNIFELMEKVGGVVRDGSMLRYGPKKGIIVGGAKQLCNETSSLLNAFLNSTIDDVVMLPYVVKYLELIGAFPKSYSLIYKKCLEMKNRDYLYVNPESQRLIEEYSYLPTYISNVMKGNLIHSSVIGVIALALVLVGQFVLMPTHPFISIILMVIGCFSVIGAVMRFVSRYSNVRNTKKFLHVGSLETTDVGQRTKLKLTVPA